MNIQTTHFPLIITMETPGSTLFPAGLWLCRELSRIPDSICSLFFLFQVLTTWRLYFLAPKIPAKVLFTALSLSLSWTVRSFYKIPNTRWTLCFVDSNLWQQVETTFNFLEIRALNSQPDHQVNFEKHSGWPLCALHSSFFSLFFLFTANCLSSQLCNRAVTSLRPSRNDKTHLERL